MITELVILSSVSLVASIKVLTDLLLQPLLLGLHAGVTHRFVLAGISLEFTAVNSDMTQFHQASPHRQMHPLSAPSCERLSVPGAEPGERPVRRLLITRE